MANPGANAKFFIELAEKGRSFAPHTPKRKSDQVALFRAICWECNRAIFLTCFLKQVPKAGDLAIVAEEGIPYFVHTRIKAPKPSPLARLRIVAYFAPILEESWLKYLKMLLVDR